MSFPPEADRPDFSISVVKPTLQNLWKAFMESPFGGPSPKKGTLEIGKNVRVGDKILPTLITGGVGSEIGPGDTVIVFTQGQRPAEDNK